jgi:26S proteasome regulatory subunit T2
MTLSDDVNLEEFVLAKDELSGADIKAVCTEAGLLALRERRMRVTQVGVAVLRLFLFLQETPNFTPMSKLHTHPFESSRQADFRKAKEKVLYKKKEGVPEGLYM